MNASVLYETSPLNSYVRKPIHFLSKQNWARKISEQASQAGTLSRVEATVCVNMIISNNSYNVLNAHSMPGTVLMILMALSSDYLI